MSALKIKHSTSITNRLHNLKCHTWILIGGYEGISGTALSKYSGSKVFNLAAERENVLDAKGDTTEGQVLERAVEGKAEIEARQVCIRRFDLLKANMLILLDLKKIIIWRG